MYVKLHVIHPDEFQNFAVLIIDAGNCFLQSCVRVIVFHNAFLFFLYFYT